MGEHTTSYRVKIQNYNHIFDQTVAIYRDAVAFIVPIVEKHFQEIKHLNENDRRNAIQRLIHNTKYNTALYDFDSKFYKLPCYLRRAAATDAIGKYSSYSTKLEEWKEKIKKDPDCKDRAPQLRYRHNSFPALYFNNMYSEEYDNETGSMQYKIKVFHQNTWKYITVMLRNKDLNYIRNHKSHIEKSAPVLVKDGNHYYLQFTFKEEYTLPEEVNRILAVDLGLNSDAAVCVMDKDGTIIARKFINTAKDKDHLYHNLNKIKRNQKKGSRENTRLWNLVKGINNTIGVYIMNEIMNIALEYNVNAIVMEYLQFKGKKKKSMRQKIHHWKYKFIFNSLTIKAHLNGIRIARVNAWNTSRLAFDGSGRVKRGKELLTPEDIASNKKISCSICKFPNGKIYNCDLNASYNIGARYFIRERIKPLDANLELLIQAKVPGLCNRSTCTLSDLISLNKCLAS